MVDDGTAAILEAVASGGFYGRTLVVVASDNGGSIDDGGNNLPHRGGKRTMFEGGVKVSERGGCAHGSLLTSSRAAFSVGRSVGRVGISVGIHRSIYAWKRASHGVMDGTLVTRHSRLLVCAQSMVDC